MVLTFSNCFWDDDFLGTTGYDALILHLKDGKKLCDAFSDFVRNRAKIEDDYGKNLIRLAQSAGSNEENGTLKESWNSIRKEVECIGSVHCELGKRFTDLVEDTLEFREKQKNDRLKADEKIKKHQKDKKVAYENLFKTKRTYEQRCKENDLAKESYEAKATYTPKEEEKFKKNLLKAKSNAENSDSVYQSSVKLLEDCHSKWMLEMEDTLKLFQKWEEQRVVFLRNEMWTYTNLGSIQLIKCDESYEKSRDVLEKCDESIDIQFFISQRRTGSEKPASIPYENYYHVKPRNNSADLYAVPNDQFFHKKSLIKSAPQFHMASHKQSIADDYSNVVGSRSGASLNTTKRNLFCATHEYSARGITELSLKPGDIIELLQLENSEWGIGYLNGQTGAFPIAFVASIR